MSKVSMKPSAGDLVRFYSGLYSSAEIIGIIINIYPMDHFGDTTYMTLCISGPERGSTNLHGKVMEIHSTVWPGYEVISEAG